MGQKLIPDSDRDFAKFARNFASLIECDPGKFGLDDQDVRRLTREVREFQEAFDAVGNKHTCSREKTLRKDMARATEQIKQYGSEVVSDPGVIPVKFRAPGGTIAELVPLGRYKRYRRAAIEEWVAQLEAPARRAVG